MPVASSDWNVVQIADFNHDGRADLLWQEAGAVSVWLADGEGWQQNASYDAVPSGRSVISHAFPL